MGTRLCVLCFLSLCISIVAGAGDQYLIGIGIVYIASLP